jgi:hypothetical protein
VNDKKELSEFSSILDGLDDTDILMLSQDIRTVRHHELMIKKLISIREISEANLAYVSGIIDGEGNIGIFKTKPSRFNGNHYYSPRLTVIMGSEEVIRKCYHITGSGKISQTRKVTKKGRAIWRWSVSGRRLVALLPYLLPHLVNKHAQGELAIEFYHFLSNIDKKIPYTCRQKEKIQKMIYNMKSMNSR